MLKPGSASRSAAGPRGCRPGRLASALLLPILLTLAPAARAQSDTLLVVHPAVAIEATSQNSARLMFSMQLRQWPDGQPLRVFILPDDDPVHRSFAKDRLGLFPRQLRRVWDRQLYSGTGQVPVTVSDQQEMQRRVAETPGALGYLSSEIKDDTVKALDIR